MNKARRLGLLLPLALVPFLALLVPTGVAASASVVHTNMVTPANNPGETQLNSVGSNAFPPHSWTSLTTHLDYQSDGNLVLYCTGVQGGEGAGTPLWASNTAGLRSPTAFLVFQSDGNLVIYLGPGRTNPVWSTMTSGNPGDFALVQNDGNFVVYAGQQPLWATTNWSYHSSACPETLHW